MDDACLTLTLWFLLVAPLSHKVAPSTEVLALKRSQYRSTGTYQSCVTKPILEL